MIKKVTTMVLLAALLFPVLSMNNVAYATDYSEKSSGEAYISISNKTNTLYYKNPHCSFNLRVYVTKPALALFVSTGYNIKMYDGCNRLVWEASNQGDRTYYIGSNVTRIVLTTNASVGVSLHWQKR
jgi:hypothetical protein